MSTNPYSQAIERSTESLLRLAMAQAEREQQQAQFQQSLDLQRQQLQVTQRRASEDERVSALNRITTMMPLMKAGALNEIALDDFQVLFPDQDRNTLASLISIPETMDNTVMPAVMQAFREMPQSSKDRVINRHLFGEPISGRGLEVQDLKETAELDALRGLMQDPDTIRRLGEQQLGYKPTRDYTLPDGTVVNITDTDVAQLASDIWKYRDTMDWYQTQLGFEKQKFTEQQKSAIIGDFTELAKLRKIALPPARARQIFDVVHYVPPGAEGMTPEEIGAARQAKLDELRTSPGWGDHLNAALDLYLSGADLSQAAPIALLKEFPGLQQYLQLGASLEDVLGKEATAEILPIIAKKMRQQGTDIFEPGRGPLNTLDIGATTPRQASDAARPTWAAPVGPINTTERVRDRQVAAAAAVAAYRAKEVDVQKLLQAGWTAREVAAIRDQASKPPVGGR